MIARATVIWALAACAAVLQVPRAAVGEAKPQPPVGSLLVTCYRGWPGNHAGLWTPDVAKGGLTYLCQGTSPVWSPDHRRIAWALPGLLGMTIPPDTEVARDFPWVSNGRGNISWSPDGRSLAFVTGSWLSQAGCRRIWFVEQTRIAGNLYPLATKYLVRPPGEDMHNPAFSPDGKALAFCRSQGVLGITTCSSVISWVALGDQTVADLEGSHLREQPRAGDSGGPADVGLHTVDLPAAGYRCERPHWSPDGSKIGFSRFDLQRLQYDACWADVDSGTVHRFPVPFENARERNASRFVAWLAAGNALVVVGPPGGDANGILDVVSPTGVVRRLPNANGIWDAVVSPDARWVAWIASEAPFPGSVDKSNQAVLVQEIETGTTVSLYGLDRPASYPLTDLSKAPLTPYELAW